LKDTSRIFDKAVIWDMDGVIVDTGPFHFEAWRELVERKGRPYTEEDFHRGFGLRNDAILQDLLGPLTPEEIISLGNEKEAMFRSKIQGRIHLLPGVLKLLETQRATAIGIALGSSAPLENVRFMLNALDIDGYFDIIVSAEDVNRGKPDPEVFLLAAKRLGVEPHRCVVIEDAVGGVEAAKAAGMHCIAVTNTHSAQALAKADVVTDNLEKITGEALAQLLTKT